LYDGEKQKARKRHFSKNNSIKDLVGNEENEHPIPDHNKIMINELSDAHKEISQGENHERHH
jgi:hypothetical protein